MIFYQKKQNNKKQHNKFIHLTDFNSYLGNANLGLSSDSSIPVTDAQPLSVINQTGRDIMLLNHENNIRKYDQKIKDRDKQLQLLDKGQIETGRVLDRDKPLIQKGREEADKAFEDLVKYKPGTPQYTEAYRNYNQKLTDFKDLVTLTQHNQLGIDDAQTSKSREQRKYKQDRIQGFIDSELSKPAGSPVGVYVPALDFDHEKIINSAQKDSLINESAPVETSTQVKDKNGKITTVKTTPPLKSQNSSNIIYKEGLPYNVTTQRYDFGKMLQNTITDYSDPTGENTEHQNTLRQNIEAAPPAIKKAYLSQIVKRVKDYNKDLGLNKGDKGYIDEDTLPEKLGLDKDMNPTGQPISISTPQFTALSALADVNGPYKISSESLLKDQATLEQNAKKIAGDQAIKWEDLKGKNALRAAQIKKLNKALEGKTPEQEQAAFDKYWASNGIYLLNGTNSFDRKIPIDKSRAIYTVDDKGQPKLLLPVGAKKQYDTYDKKGNPIPGTSKVVGYSGGDGYDGSFYNKSTGTDIDIKMVRDAFEVAKKRNPSLTQEDYMVNLGKNGITYRLTGENGSANIDDNANALRILNNKYKQGKEDAPIFSDSELFKQDKPDE